MYKNAVEFIDLKDCNRDATAQSKGYNILANVESVDDEMKSLLLGASE